MQNLKATTSEVVHLKTLWAVHYKPLQEVHSIRYSHSTSGEHEKQQFKHFAVHLCVKEIAKITGSTLIICKSILDFQRFDAIV